MVMLMVILGHMTRPSHVTFLILQMYRRMTQKVAIECVSGDRAEVVLSFALAWCQNHRSLQFPT